MKRYLYWLVLMIIAVFFFSCLEEETVISSSTTTSNTPTTPATPITIYRPEEWLIPSDQIIDGGPGKDGIIVIDNPQFSKIAEIDFLNPEDLVIAVNFGTEARAYPHPILDWHEIINDEIGDIKLALTYCPLTGTGIGWNRVINSQVTSFGSSGLLYNTNLLAYDRATDSYWSQMRNQCVNGEQKGIQVNTYHSVEMSYAAFQKMYPDGSILNTNTGFNKKYGTFPLGGYRTSPELLFPVNNKDGRLYPKERVLGVVVNSTAKAYTFTNFSDANITAIQDTVGGTAVVIVGNERLNFMTAYKRQLADGTFLSFEAVQDRLPVVLTDNEGNEWDAFGNALSGSRAGTQLEAPLNYIGYWFAWAAFHPEIDIFLEDGEEITIDSIRGGTFDKVY